MSLKKYALLMWREMYYLLPSSRCDLITETNPKSTSAQYVAEEN